MADLVVPPEAMSQAFLAKYATAVALVAFVYDHLLTLDQEVRHIWGNCNRGIVPKLIWAMNRYLTEAMVTYMAYAFSGAASNLDDSAYAVTIKPIYWHSSSSTDFVIFRCNRLNWVFALSGTVFVSTTHFIVVLRLFNLWDRQTKIANILISGFTIVLVTAMGLMIYMTLQVREIIHFVHQLNICVLDQVPRNMPSFLAVWLGFDIFLIVVAFYNALDRPHRTNVEVIDIVLRDGSFLLLGVFAIRLIPLVLSIVGSPVQAVSSVNALWVIDSIVSSRVHLRVESLRNTKFRSRSGVLELQETSID